jgi:hypothetical protein
MYLLPRMGTPVHSNSLVSELEHAIASKSRNRGAILHQITDLFLVNVGKYSVDQLDVYDDVFSKLVEKIEVSARAELARRLAPIDGVPPKTIRLLALDDDIEVAEPVLAQSSDLDDDTLVRCAASKGQGHRLAIATRLRLSEKVSEQLVKMGGKQVLGALVSNPGAKISDGGFKSLVHKSVGVDWLSEAIALRKDIPERHFRELISKASETVIQRLKAADPMHGAIIKEIVSTIASQDKPRKPTERRDFRVANLVVDPFVKSGALTEEVVMEFAEAKKIDEVIDAIAQLANLSARDIECLIMDTWSSVTACVLKAIGFHLKTLHAIYCMRLSKGEAPGDDLFEAKKEFVNLSRTTAERIMRFYKARLFGSRKTDR